MTSGLDILFIVLAFCALWVTAFVCWAVYHIAMVARRVHLVLDEAKVMLAQIEVAIGGLRDKVDHHAKLLDPLVGLAGSVVKEVYKSKTKK